MTDLNQNLISFQNLLVVAASDGGLGDEEKEILISMGIDMGLTPEVLKSLVMADSLNFILHDKLENNIEDLGDMLTIAASDGIVHESEFAVCKDFADAAGISESLFTEMLEYAKQYQDEDEQ